MSSVGNRKQKETHWVVGGTLDDESETWVCVQVVYLPGTKMAGELDGLCYISSLVMPANALYLCLLQTLQGLPVALRAKTTVTMCSMSESVFSAHSVPVLQLLC